MLLIFLHIFRKSYQVFLLDIRTIIGIGVFDNIVVIDIDKCVTNGKLNKFARKIVNKLKSYTEISISGTGIHIVTFASGLVFDKGRY